VCYLWPGSSDRFPIFCSFRPSIGCLWSAWAFVLAFAMWPQNCVACRFLWRGTQGLDLVYRQGHYIELCYKYEIYLGIPAIRVSMLTLSLGPLAFWLWPHEKCCQWYLPGLLWYFMWCPWHGKGNPCCIIKALSLRPLSHSVRLMAANDTHLSDAHPWIPKMGTSKYLVWHWLA